MGQAPKTLYFTLPIKQLESIFSLDLLSDKLSDACPVKLGNTVLLDSESNLIRN